MTIATGTLVGAYDNADGSPAVGLAYTLVPSSAEVRDASTGLRARAGTITGTLDAAGSFSQAVAASDANTDPTGVTWTCYVEGRRAVAGIAVPTGQTVSAVTAAAAASYR